MIEDAINYPRESDDVLKTVLIGGLCLLFSFLIVPAFLVLGYVLQVLDRTADGDDEPPVFEEWGELLVEGGKAFLITIVYGIVPALVVMLTVGVGILGVFGGETTGILGGVVVMVGLLVAFVLNLVVAYVLPAALANYTETRRIGAGFDFGTLRNVVFERAYAVGWLTAFVLVLAGGIVTSLLSVVPIIGTILGVFVTFYALVSAYYVIGHTWSDVREGETVDTEPIGGGVEA